MSRFLAMLLDSAARSEHGMVTGEPKAPVRHSWRDVHATARRMAATLRTAVDGRPPAVVGVLAAEPATIAPAVQAGWLTGGAVTRLHQPTGRTDLAAWARDTVSVLAMIGAELVLLGPPFDALGPVLAQRGIAFRAISSLAAESPDESPEGAGIEPDPAVAGEDDVALLQL